MVGDPRLEIPHRKVPFTAAVLVPPRDLWPPIQAIRREHDSRIDRWMPHITLLYPFVPEPHLEDAAEWLQPLCSSMLRFRVTLGEFRFFLHGGRWATLWLRPEPPGPVERLQRQLVDLFPWCDDTSRYADGFTPHLSVGRWPAVEAEEAAAALQDEWQPLEWEVERLCLIARPEAGDEPFEIKHEIRFG